MKPKNFSKKLILNKKTIAHLNNKEMKGAAGGKPPFTNGTWCDGSCWIPIGGGSGCNSVYPEACVCPNP